MSSTSPSSNVGKPYTLDYHKQLSAVAQQLGLDKLAAQEQDEVARFAREYGLV